MDIYWKTVVTRGVAQQTMMISGFPLGNAEGHQMPTFAEAQYHSTDWGESLGGFAPQPVADELLPIDPSHLAGQALNDALYQRCDLEFLRAYMTGVTVRSYGL